MLSERISHKFTYLVVSVCLHFRRLSHPYSVKKNAITKMDVEYTWKLCKGKVTNIGIICWSIRSNSRGGGGGESLG